jgi:hypothetical protein
MWVSTRSRLSPAASTLAPPLAYAREMRTTIRLDDDLLAEAREIAAENRKNLSTFIEDALRAAIARARKPAEHVPLDLPIFGEGGLLPDVDLDQSIALLDPLDLKS